MQLMNSIKNLSFLVYGLGLTGKSAVSFFKRNHFKNYQVWDDTALVPATGRPPEGYPVFTVRTAAVNALGIPTVFFLGAILAMQFKSY